MERDEIITQLSSYFNIKELVCPHVYGRWGERAWQFLETAYLHTLLVLRKDILRSPMVCNNSSSFTQRGLRCNRCELVLSKQTPYLSAHVLGKGGDFTVSGMSAEEARNMIKENSSMLPCNIRLEDGVSWLHMDVVPQWGITQKVYEFKV